MEGRWIEMPNFVLSKDSCQKFSTLIHIFPLLVYGVSSCLLPQYTRGPETVSPETFSDIKFHKFQRRTAKLPPGPLRSIMSRSNENESAKGSTILKGLIALTRINDYNRRLT